VGRRLPAFPRSCSHAFEVGAVVPRVQAGNVEDAEALRMDSVSVGVDVDASPSKRIGCIGGYGNPSLGYAEHDKSTDPSEP